MQLHALQRREPELAMSYHQFRNDEGEPYGSFEVWEADRDIDRDLAPGWYWWACFPGCLPDGDPMGPFDTEADAIADAEGS